MSEREIPREWLDGGADIVGGVSGAAIGLLVAGPAGAVAGGATGPAVAATIRHVASDVAQRLLSRREQVRVGGVLGAAAERISERQQAGEHPRTDGFFETAPNERSAADELVEGVLLAAQREHEEKKIRYYGNLLASIAFTPGIPREMANALLRLGRELAWRQLCVLAALARQAELAMPSERPRRADVAVELFELYRLHLLAPQGGGYWLSVGEVIPGRATLTPFGTLLCTLMELERIPRDALAQLMPQLEPAPG